MGFFIGRGTTCSDRSDYPPKGSSSGRMESDLEEFTPLLPTEVLLPGSHAKGVDMQILLSKHDAIILWEISSALISWWLLKTDHPMVGLCEIYKMVMRTEVK